MIKEYYKKQDEEEGRETVSIAVMPCVAKKWKPDARNSSVTAVPDVDYVITPRS